jgi:cytoskeletal protein RodZ
MRMRGTGDMEGGESMAMNSAKREDWNQVSDKNPGGPETSPQAVAEAADNSGESNLGRFLVEARERRSVGQDAAVKETRIPGHYLRMLESNDYSKISDQLYLLPFLRRYATYLALDPEEIAMRFVREVQRADNLPPSRIDEPLLIEPRRNYNWLAIGGVVVLLAIIAFTYSAISRHHQDNPASNSSASQSP